MFEIFIKKTRKIFTVTISIKTVFFVFPANREPGPDFFSLKPSRDQDEDNDIRYRSIGSAVFELLDDTQTDRHPVTLYNGIYV